MDDLDILKNLILSLDHDLDPLLELYEMLEQDIQMPVDCESNNLFKSALVLCESETFSPPSKRRKKIPRNRKESWEFILSWSETDFYRQFRILKEEFLILVERCKNIYPGKSSRGIENYRQAQKMGQVSTPNSGPITMEIKVAITLRMLAGAAYLDMIWYGVQLDSVHPIFVFTIELIDKALPNHEIFNFNPENLNFTEECQRISNEWSSLMINKKGFDLFPGNYESINENIIISLFMKTWCLFRYIACWRWLSRSVYSSINGRP